MIPKIIHQIFHNWGTDLKDVELFKKSVATLKEKNPEFTHKLWSKEDSLKLIETKYPQYLQFYKDLRHNIQRVDFSKICIVHSEGGFYVDLDMHCIKSFKPLLNETLIIESNKHLVPKHNEFVQNDFLASEKGFRFWEVVLNECVKNYKVKSKVEVYDIWKGRFVLQTTGPRFLSRAVKKFIPKYKPYFIVWHKWRNELWKVLPRTDYYVECFRSGSWLNDTNSNLKTHKTFK